MKKMMKIFGLPHDNERGRSLMKILGRLNLDNEERFMEEIAICEGPFLADIVQKIVKCAKTG